MAAAPQPRMHGSTHVPGGSDPIPGLPEAAPGGDTIDAVLAALDPAGWWKLNESSGSTAYDSSGNGLDMTVPGGRADPLWGSGPGPPGEQTADFESGGPSTATLARVDRSWADVGSSSFTAGLFVNINAGHSSTHIMGQGNPNHGGSGYGWELMVPSGAGGKPSAFLAGVGNLLADNTLATGTWAMLTVTKSGTNPSSSTWRLYVNGLLQASTPYTGSFQPYTTGGLWIGSPDGILSFTETGGYFLGSYAYMFPVALSGTDILSIYNSAILPGGTDAGKALLTDGLGGTYWDFALEVSY